MLGFLFMSTFTVMSSLATTSNQYTSIMKANYSIEGNYSQLINYTSQDNDEGLTRQKIINENDGKQLEISQKNVSRADGKDEIRALLISNSTLIKRKNLGPIDINQETIENCNNVIETQIPSTNFRKKSNQLKWLKETKNRRTLPNNTSRVISQNSSYLISANKLEALNIVALKEQSNDYESLNQEERNGNELIHENSTFPNQTITSSTPKDLINEFPTTTTNRFSTAGLVSGKKSAATKQRMKDSLFNFIGLIKPNVIKRTLQKNQSIATASDNGKDKDEINGSFTPITNKNQLMILTQPIIRPSTTATPPLEWSSTASSKSQDNLTMVSTKNTNTLKHFTTPAAATTTTTTTTSTTIPSTVKKSSLVSAWEHTNVSTPKGIVSDNSHNASFNGSRTVSIDSRNFQDLVSPSSSNNKSEMSPYGTLVHEKKPSAPFVDLKQRLNDALFENISRTTNKSYPSVTATSRRDFSSYIYGRFATTKSSIYLATDAFPPTTATPTNEISVNNKLLQEIPWPVKKEAVVEGDLVLGGLMMVHEREDTITCGPVMPQGGIQALEAMLYTLDRLNLASDPLLPNISLGAHILDDCDKDTYGLEMAVDFIKGSISNIDGAEYHCNKTQVRKVISGVVGAASSVTSIQVANLLRLFKIPQVSFFSTSPELSNKQRFEFFTRTIPSDHYQVKAMVDIVRLMNWSYISIIYEESNYGIKAFEELEDLLGEHNICIAVKEKLVKDSGVADESAYDNIVQKLLTKPRARGCIIFGSDQEVAGVMRAVRRSNATGNFLWIGSDGWSARSLVSDDNEAEVEGTLSVQPQANPVRGFEKYFLSLNVENNPRNPWFVEFWEHHFQCRYPNSTKTPYNQKHTPLCTGREKLTANNTVFEDQLQFVSDAVMAFAYAIRDMHQDLCHGRPGLCDAMKPTKGTELLKYLRKVDFEGLSGDRFHFDSNGDGPARYNIIHFKRVSTDTYKWVKVGEYVEGELRLNMSEIQFKLGNPKPPESVCSFPCDLGQAKKYVEGESCCWHCFNCTQYQIRHPSDPTQCVPCPQGTVPDPHHIRCNNIPEEYLRPDSGWAIGAMALSSTGVLITMFVCGVFIRHNDTPVVRASGRELSYVLLAGILMCYSVTYALVLRPNDIVCGIQRFGAGFCFTVVYAALLTKTNRISRIFNAGKHSAKRPSFISPRSQLIICSGLVGVQVLINGVWMVISPAHAIHHYPTRDDNLLVCSSYIDASYMIAFTYPIFLIVICTVYAVLTRKIPEAFNESKHIGFTMYTTCVIWLAFVPLYFGTANHVALRITSMSVTISLSASVTVACLFSPKLYIILIRPERNVRQSMMPMRYSAINKSSATTGSGSMMAAVMVTAATCDQKQQIQKHVPPIEKDEETDLSDSKVKPQCKDTSTQTTPYSSNNMLKNSSLEHLPKLNNNCSVGNGPMLPNVQIKDFAL